MKFTTRWQSSALTDRAWRLLIERLLIERPAALDHWGGGVKGFPRLPSWLEPWTKKRGTRTLSDPARSLANETVLYTSILMVGVFGLSLLVAIHLAPGSVSTLPEMPDGAFSTRTPLAAWIFAVLFLSAIAVGGGRLVYRLMRESASNEFRHVLVRRAGRLGNNALDFLGSNTDGGPRPSGDDDPAPLPAVPYLSALTDSPGERLRYRLPSASPASDLLGIAALSLLWNAAWFVLAAIAVSGWWRGIWRPFLIGLLIPLGWIGWWSFKTLITRVRKSTGVGPTVVEISDHPLMPGGNYDVYVAQWGRMKLSKLTVRLVCEEETFYRQGTDVRVQRHPAMSSEIGSIANLEVDPRHAAEQQLRLSLPPGVMHSLAGAHNAIRWRIEVQGESRQWPSFCRSFPVVVHPPSAAVIHPRPR